MTPPWADNPRARQLIDELVANPPRTFVRSADDWRHDASEVFQPFGCPAFGELKRMYNAWFEREFRKLDIEYRITGVWDDAASRALHMTPDADALLRQALADAQTTETRGDPLRRVA